ncbi:MAG TPA: dTMP kinase [Ktedonobacterales bacterium]|nr:dTMP kinase [Ktedonobacterales bacterium]
MSGYFITFEGGDGSGKSTQARLLAARLETVGRGARLTREPGGTPLAGAMRALLLHPEASLAALAGAGLASGAEPAEAMLPLTEALLLSAARAQHVARIRDWLEEGDTVISDRYADATLAYQGYARGYELDALRTLERLTTSGLRPNLTLLLDVSIEEGQRRKHAGHADGEELNRLDTEALAFHQRVRDGYLALARAEPDRWVILDATIAPDALAEQVWRVVSGRIGG